MAEKEKKSDNSHRNCNKINKTEKLVLSVNLIEKLIKEFEINRTINKIISFNCQKALCEGGNFCSELCRISIEATMGTDENDKKIVENKFFFIKSFPKDEVTADIVKRLNSFNTELDMYTNILPMMKEVIREFDLVDDKLWAETIGLIPDNNILIFEDLSELGFSVANREKGFDILHTSFALKALARFHSISLVLNQRGKLDKNILLNKSKNNFVHLDESYRDIVLAGFKFIVEAIREGKWGPEWISIAERVENYFKIVGDLCFDFYYNRKDPLLNVLCHGDSWVNNLMFKYSKLVPYPTEIRFVDFQLSHFDSFAYDITYLFYTSLTTELRNEKFDFFLNIYHQALYRDFQLLKLPINLLPNIMDVQNEMDKLLHFAVITHCFVYPIISYDGKEDLLDFGRMGVDSNFKNYYINEKTIKNMKGTFQYFVEKGLF